jgi:hypothetical protein
MELNQLQEAVKGSDPYVSLAQASRHVGVPLSTLSDAVRNKRIPALIMPDKRRYVRLSVVKAYRNQKSNGRASVLSGSDALLAIVALSRQKGMRGLMPKDFSQQHDHYLYGTPKR